MTDLLARTFYHNTLGTWGAALGIGLAVYLGLRLVRRLLTGRLAAFAAHTRIKFDDAVLASLGRTRGFFLAAVGLYAGSTLLTLPPHAQKVVVAIVTVAAVLQFGFWGNAIAAALVEEHARRAAGDGASAATTTVNALGVLARLLFWAVLVLLGLDNLGVNITTLVAGLGVGGVAVALAVQNVLGDLFASLSIVLDQPFVIGDFIIVDDLMGSVEHIGLKTTRIRSLSGEQLVFSNADLLKSRIRNYKRMQERRILFAVGVEYDTPPEQMAAIPATLREIVEAQDGVRFDRAHFKGFGASSMDFEIVYYVLNPDYTAYMNIQQAINLEILKRFNAEGIGFAFPTRTVHLVTDGAVAPAAGPAPPSGRQPAVAKPR